MFTDVKGTVIELYSDYTFAKDDGAQTAITPLKLGHIAHRVDDVQKTVKFYTDVLGFRVSDWHGDYFAFLRCGVDHHTVNFVYNEKPQLHHIAFEVRDWSELHRAGDFLARKDVHLVWGPLRHIIGHNIAAYHRDPDNIRVELYCEMDQMKDEALGYFDPRPWHQDRPAGAQGLAEGHAAQLLGLRLARHVPGLSVGLPMHSDAVLAGNAELSAFVARIDAAQEEFALGRPGPVQGALVAYR